MKRTLTISIEAFPILDDEILAPYIDLMLRKYICSLRTGEAGQKKFETMEMRTNDGTIIVMRASARVDE